MSDCDKCPTCGHRIQVVSIPTVWLEYDPPPTTPTVSGTSNKTAYVDLSKRGEVQ